jgi:hypothetical protein
VLRTEEPELEILEMASRKSHQISASEPNLEASSLSEESSESGSSSEAGGAFDTIEELETEIRLNALVEEHSSHYRVNANHTVEKLPMSLIDPVAMGIGSFEELSAMPEGFEAHLRIISVRRALNVNGDDYLQPMLEVVGEPLAKDFTHYLPIPNKETMNTKQYNAAGRSMQEFMMGFGISIKEPTDPLTEWEGHEGWNILGLQESPKYGKQNKLGRFIRSQEEEISIPF